MLVPITAIGATIYYGSRSAEPGETIAVPEAHAAALEDADAGHRDASVAAKLLSDRRAKIAAEADKQRAADEALRQTRLDQEAKAREQAAYERAKRAGAVKAPAAQPAALPSKPSADTVAKV